MGRRTATALLRARGTAATPQNTNDDEPQPEVLVKGPIKPPSHLTKEEKEVWREIRDVMPHGVLTVADTFSMELVATLMVQFRKMKAKMPGPAMLRLSNELGKLGMNPADRSIIRVPKGSRLKGNKTKEEVNEHDMAGLPD